MAIISETDNFIVESHEKPFVSREEGGHIRIRIKDKSITDRTKLDPKVAIELIRLTMVVGEAMELGMNERGVPVVKINYQDMGNWAYKTGEKPFLHVHIFGRVLNVPHQPYPESVYLPNRSSGFYDNFVPLDNEDIVTIQTKIKEIFTQEKYQDKNWTI